jgi:hypothetical protein
MNLVAGGATTETDIHWWWPFEVGALPARPSERLQKVLLGRRRISRLREGNCLPFTLNGLDVTTAAASNSSMGRSYSSERCKHCGGSMVLVMPADGKGPGALRCWECDQIDPLQLPWSTAWFVGELRPPK